MIHDNKYGLTFFYLEESEMFRIENVIDLRLKQRIYFPFSFFFQGKKCPQRVKRTCFGCWATVSPFGYLLLKYQMKRIFYLFIFICLFISLM